MPCGVITQALKLSSCSLPLWSRVSRAAAAACRQDAGQAHIASAAEQLPIASCQVRSRDQNFGVLIRDGQQPKHPERSHFVPYGEEAPYYRRIG